MNCDVSVSLRIVVKESCIHARRLKGSIHWKKKIIYLLLLAVSSPADLGGNLKYLSVR